MRQSDTPSVDRLLALADELALTDAQKTKLREIRRKTPGALMSKRQAVAEARLDLQDLLAQENTSGADLRRAHDKLVKSQGDLQAARFDLKLQVREVLTPEQRDKVRDAARDRMRQRVRMPRFHGFDLDDGDEPQDQF
jgi:Spy/CpxP family protein refolding chaperone